MLNQTLSKKTLTLLVRLREERRPTLNAITELLRLEREAAVEALSTGDDTNTMYRAQGAVEQLNELCNLFENIDTFKGLFNE